MTNTDIRRRRLISYFLLLFLYITASFFCTCKVHADGRQGREAGVGAGNNQRVQPNVECQHTKVPSNSFKIIHRFGPCSPSSSIPSNTNYEEILRQEILRVTYLQRRRMIRYVNPYRKSTMDPQQDLVRTTMPVWSGTTIGNGLYFIIVSLGMPRRNQTVNFDTGSSFSWIQCRPCRSCKQQRDPLFDPELSHSYRRVACDDPACTHLPHDVRGCAYNACTYNISYVDSDYTKGFVSKERLLLPTSAVEFPNFVFGCGHNNKVMGEGTAGLFGLGHGYHSLVAQTSNRFGRSFSYCLPSLDTGEGYLTLGRKEGAPGTTYARMLTNLQIDPDIYLINLTAISINNQRMQLPPQIMERGGTVIDSGTTLTYLPRDLYRQLRDFFRQDMSHYQYQSAPAYMNMDTCYSINRPSFPYPNVTFHFDSNVDLVLNFAQVFFDVDRSTYCLGFSSMRYGVIASIGTVQQRGMDVIYDIEQQRFGFYRRANCH